MQHDNLRGGKGQSGPKAAARTCHRSSSPPAENTSTATVVEGINTASAEATLPSEPIFRQYYFGVKEQPHAWGRQEAENTLVESLLQSRHLASLGLLQASM